MRRFSIRDTQNDGLIVLERPNAFEMMLRLVLLMILLLLLLLVATELSLLNLAVVRSVTLPVF